MDEATEAARRVAGASGIDLLEKPVLLPGVANTVLHFRAAGVVAKVAVRERFRNAVRREHAIAVELARLGAAAPRPLEGTSAAVDEVTGYVVTLWHHIPHDPTVAPDDDDCLAALDQLHHALDRTLTPVPRFTDELVAARDALDGGFAPELAPADRELLAGTFASGLATLEAGGFDVHRLHGEPHAANRLVTPEGVVWIDLESCCSGPREWDLAFLPAPAVDGRPGVDHGLLALLRLLNAARFATWQSGLVGTYPDLGPLAAANLAIVRDA